MAPQENFTELFVVLPWIFATLAEKLVTEMFNIGRRRSIRLPLALEIATCRNRYHDRCSYREERRNVFLYLLVSDQGLQLQYQPREGAENCSRPGESPV